MLVSSHRTARALMRRPRRKRRRLATSLQPMQLLSSPRSPLTISLFLRNPVGIGTSDYTYHKLLLPHPTLRTTLTHDDSELSSSLFCSVLVFGRLTSKLSRIWGQSTATHCASPLHLPHAQRALRRGPFFQNRQPLSSLPTVQHSQCIRVPVRPPITDRVHILYIVRAPQP